MRIGKIFAGVATALVVAAVFVGCSNASKQARHASRGDRYVEKGDFASAEVEYLNALRYAPENTALIKKLAGVFRQQGRTQRAMLALKEASRLQPGDLEARREFAELLFTLRVYPKAREEALAVVTNQASPSALLTLVESSFAPAELAQAEALVAKASQPSPSPEVRFARASLYSREGKLAAAEAELKAASAGDRTTPALDLAWAKLRIAQTNLVEGEVLLKRAADASPLRSAVRLQWIDFRLLRGDLAGAKKVLDEMAATAPDYLPAILRLADIALTERRFADCEKLTAQALRVEGESYEALLLRARMWTAQGHLDKAMNELVRLDAVAPKNAGVKYELAVAQARAGERSKAIALANEAISLDPRLVQAGLLKAQLSLGGATPDPDTAIGILVPMVKQNPQFKQAAVLLGRAYMIKGQTAEAMRVYKEISARYQTDPELWVLLGISLSQSRDTAGARSAFEHALAADPLYFHAVEQLADLDLQAGDVSTAVRRAREFAQRATNRIDGLLLESRIHVAVTNFRGAEAALEKASQRAPDSFAVFAALSDLYLRMTNYDQSLARIETAIARNQNVGQAWALKGIIHERRHETDKAIDAYSRAIKIDGNYAPALNNLAMLLAEQPNSLDEAHALATRARTANPVHPAIADTLGWICFKRREFPAARALLNESAEKLQNAEVYYHAGMADYAMGDARNAQQWFERALSLPGLDKQLREDIQGRLSMLSIPADRMQPAQIESLEAAVKRDPHDYIAQYRLGRARIQQGKTAEAVRCFEAAARANPQAYEPCLALAQLLSNGDRTQALQWARDARKLAPANAVVALTLGELTVGAHDYSRGLALLEEGMRGQAATPEQLHALAVAQVADGKIGEAGLTLTNLVRSATGRTQQLANEGLLLLGGGGDPERSAAAERRLKADPADLFALIASGEMAQQHGDAKKAAATYEKVVTAAPACFPIRQRLAALYLDALGDDKSAYAHAMKARQQAPSDPRVARVLGGIAVKRGSFTDALRYLQESVNGATDGEPYYLMGVANCGLHRTNDARIAFTKAATLPLKPELAAEAKRRLAELK